jgi:hypothetical protein
VSGGLSSVKFWTNLPTTVSDFWTDTTKIFEVRSKPCLASAWGSLLVRRVGEHPPQWGQPPARAEPGLEPASSARPWLGRA